MHRAKLLDRRTITLTTGDILVATDVFLHRLEPSTLEALRRALEQGMTPSGLDFTGDDDSIVILRFARPRAGEPRLMAASNSIPKRTRLSARSTTPSPDSSTPRKPAMVTSPEASTPRSPASFANWRRRSLATRPSDNPHRPTSPVHPSPPGPYIPVILT